MENRSRFFRVILLVAIYVFAISVSARSAAPPRYQISANNEFQTSLCHLHSAIYFHAAQENISTSGITTLPIKEVKDQLGKLVALVDADDFLITTEFTQYTKFVVNLLIKYRKTDLLFPFHYFW